MIKLFLKVLRYNKNFDTNLVKNILKYFCKTLFTN